MDTVALTVGLSLEPPATEASRAPRRGGLSLLLFVAGLVQLNLVSALYPAAAEALTFDRTAIAVGELWRIATGHFVHWSIDHAVYDLLAAALLLMLLRHQSLMRHVVVALGSTLAIAATVWFLRPDLESYRGLSGLDAAWFTWLILLRWREADSWRTRVVPVLALLLLAIKVLWEMHYDAAVFVTDSALVVPEAHVAGALVGTAVGLVGGRTEVSSSGAPAAISEGCPVPAPALGEPR